ncbi:FAD-binding oxidoreductase [Microvirga mediterraneensis]|uniref:FAD-binding oxidoreductase n=1 Tax=Microvirga mediterraneensis TaxID=2754695 RepID=A0A838BT95_9HYPH|nr:FAD-binding oxidoreductase [Microvirga mediterraneensis]MBA1158175.1 FAD-binding oxidoreductase [Microvirga mediterraneensis]
MGDSIDMQDGRPTPDAALAQKCLRSFDGGVLCNVRTVKPESYRAISALGPGQTPFVPRGQGLSYAAASFGSSSTAIDMRSFDRVLDYDSDTGEVVVEAGMTLASLFEFLLRKGRYLPVQPGHGQISVGGCIAANVHGKNQARDGTFYDQVQQITLFHPRHGIVTVSREQSPTVFETTCGGYGLTGLILTARLRTRRIPGGTVTMKTSVADRPETGMEMISKAAASCDVAYSWHDMIGTAGSGLVVTGSFDEGPLETERRQRHRTISSEWRAAMPISVQTALVGRAVNTLYRILNGPGERKVHLREALFPAQGKEIYFRLFGRAGFHEYQAIVPVLQFPEYIAQVRASARKHRVPIVLASGKSFDGVSKLLRFTGAGTCFAINVPRTRTSLDFLAELDGIAIDLGCRPNIIKDARLPRSVVEATYPDYDRFKRLLSEWDPERMFRSELSERLGL